MPFSLRSFLTVVPWRAAISERVSPFLMVTLLLPCFLFLPRLLLFQKRATVDVNDAQPTYSRPRSSYSRHSAYSRSKKSSKRGRNRKQGNKSVTIKNGDTLSEIAARHGTTVKKLRKLNGIKGNSIRAGKKIKVK
jgi:hypothetical protein